MNLAALIVLAEGQFLPGFVAVELMTHPTATDTELRDVVEGDLKHFLRGKISFAVDILWAFTPVKQQIDAAVSKAITDARGSNPPTPALANESAPAV